MADAAADRGRDSGQTGGVPNRAAALAKSGTVTLELALAGVPMVAAYKVSAIEYTGGRADL